MVTATALYAFYTLAWRLTSNNSPRELLSPELELADHDLPSDHLSAVCPPPPPGRCSSLPPLPIADLHLRGMDHAPCTA